MNNYICSDCKYSWYQEKADKCYKCGSKNILIELPEDAALVF